MKRIIYILAIVAVLFAFSTCENFMDVHKDFIKDGEIIYSPKVDSMVFIAGKERLQLRCWLYNSPNVKSIDLYWNNRADSLFTTVTPTTGRDSFYIIVPNLPEKSYTFDVRTTDAFGHKSLWTSNVGNTYGANYQNTLGNRRINTVSLVERDGAPNGRITFFSAAELQVRNEVRYTKSDGAIATLSIPASLSEILLPAAKGGSSFETRSYYIPEKQAIDTFVTAWVASPTLFPLIYQYDRSGWKVHSCSDERADDGGGMHVLIDGNTSNYWHSQWGPDVPLPHWVIIDLGKPLNAVQIDLYRRPNNTDTKTVQIFLGDEPVADGTWKQIAETVFNANLMVVTPSDKTTKGRYLKLFLPDSNRPPYVNLSEVYLYGGS